MVALSLSSGTHRPRCFRYLTTSLSESTPDSGAPTGRLRQGCGRHKKQEGRTEVSGADWNAHRADESFVGDTVPGALERRVSLEA